MKILHICSDYSKQKLYSEMLTHLSEQDTFQFMYVPVRTEKEIGKHDVSNQTNIQIHYSYVLSLLHRFFFKRKIKTVYSDLIRKINSKKFDLVHAHFLFSDGAVALELYKQFQIPYVVSVRNTDVNYFFKYCKHLKSYGNEILNNAREVIFVTPTYKKVVKNKYVSSSLMESFEDKCTILPNGLNKLWFSIDRSYLQKKRSKILKLLYVGDFTPNKNVETIIDTAVKLHNEGYSVSLTLVGGGGKGSEKTMQKISADQGFPITFLGRVNDKENLMRIYQGHDIFVMPSFRETFGIVYIEALSQGVPIIFTKNQGVDGYFSKDKMPGLPVTPNNTGEIVKAVKEIYKKIDTYSANALDVAEQFNWDLIANKLFKIYKSNIHE